MVNQHKFDFEAVLLSERIKSQEPIRIILADNDVLQESVKWFTKSSLGTLSGKIINRKYIKIIET